MKIRERERERKRERDLLLQYAMIPGEWILNEELSMEAQIFPEANEKISPGTRKMREGINSGRGWMSTSNQECFLQQSEFQTIGGKEDNTQRDDVTTYNSRNVFYEVNENGKKFFSAKKFVPY